MTENKAEAPLSLGNDVWHVDFHLSYHPESMEPNYINMQVSRGIGPVDARIWEHDGISSFEGPQAKIPRPGEELLPFLLHHLFMIRDWVTQEYVQRSMAEVTDTISEKVGVSVPRTTLRPVE